MPDRPDDLDRAYRDAVRVLDDEAGAKRRRRAVLAAVNAAGPASSTAVRQPPNPSLASDDQLGAGLNGAAAPTATSSAVPSPTPGRAANEAQWRSGASWWRGAAAASVLVTSALLVLHGRDQPPGASADRAPERIAAPTPALAAPPAIPEARVESTSARAAARLGAPPSALDTPAEAAVTGPALAQSAKVAAARTAFPAQDATATRAVGQAAAQPPGEPSAASQADVATAQAAESAQYQVDLEALREQGFKALSIRPPAGVNSHAPDLPAALPAPRSARMAAASSVSAAPGGHPRVDQAASAAGRVAVPPAAPARGAGLLEAAAAGDADAVEVLLSRVAPDAERDAQGRTALALAVLRSDSRSVSLLLAHGADRHLPDRQGQTPLDAAIRLGDPAVLKALGLP
jgi:hypothetical protein